MVVYLAALVVILAVSKVQGQYNPSSTKVCEAITTVKEGQCSDDKGFANLPQINGAYCFNNGSYLCKMFSGRFEFLYDYDKGEIRGPIGASKYVDSNGYHKRVPVAYNPNGDIIYADRVINFASDEAIKMKGAPRNLLASDSFNWCQHTVKDYWPYKSAIRDPTNRYLFYFHNRQSCVYDTKDNNYQHYNTRFLHNSSLRIDLDVNPTIFALQDPKSNKVMLMKHYRQHWYQVEFQVLAKPPAKTSISYFVLMTDPSSVDKCLICGGRPFIPKSAYKNYTKACISDEFLTQKSGKNNKLLQAECGYDQTEMSDLNVLEAKQPFQGEFEADKLPKSNSVHLHGIPRYPTKTENFFGLDIRSHEHWEVFAKDGYTFTAVTSIPKGNNSDSVRVIALYAEYKASRPSDVYDEHYPMPFLAQYNAKKNGETYEVDFTTNADKEERKTLNYVDDIAWLYKCKTILVIFGPFYTETKATEKTKDLFKEETPIGSIQDLSIWEPATAFFNEPDTDIIWVFHRMNWVTKIRYTCGKPLVTAVKADGNRYYPRQGKGSVEPFVTGNQPSFVNSEEFLFKQLGVFKGSYMSPEAPNPTDYPLRYDPRPEPAEDSDNTWIYVIIAIAVLLIIAMCLICLLTLRRRRRRQGQDPRTRRSGLLPSGSSNMPSARSGLASAHSSALKTKRTGLASQLTGAPSATPTNRSRMSSRAGSMASNATARSSGLPASSAVSGASGATARSSGLPAASTASGASARSGLPSSSAAAASSGGGGGVGSRTHRSSLSKRSPSRSHASRSAGSRSASQGSQATPGKMSSRSGSKTRSNK